MRLAALFVPALALAGGVLTACTRSTEVSDAAPAAPIASTTSEASLAPSAAAPESASPPSVPSSTDAEARARAAVEALRVKDMNALAGLVDHDDGVRFSPYSSVDSSDVRLTATQVASALRDKTVRHWGAYDGSGDPIDLTFGAYYRRFIFDVDFTKGTHPPKSLGENTVNNAQEFYGADARVIELYVAPNAQGIVGKGWRTLRLVWKPKRGDYYLVGVIHAEWTI
jgi:hypothetical protein